jgi:hypothetical protein
MTRSVTSDVTSTPSGRGRTTRCAARVLLAALVVLALPGAASADDGEAPDPAAAALFKSGREAIDRGDWEGGCAKLAQSLARYPNASTQLNLARCAEHDGKTATAWAMYQRALGLVREVAGEKRREELRAIAVEGASRLEPLLPMLEVVVRTAGGEALPLHVQVVESGRDLPRDQAVPLDPGPHEVVVTAEGYAIERRSVTLAQGKLERLEIELRSVAISSPPPPKSATPQRSPSPHRPEGSGAPAWAWIAGGVGIVTGALAVGFALDAKAAAGELEEACGADLVCDPDAPFRPDALNDRKNVGVVAAITLGAVSVVGLGVGIIGIATADTGPSTVAVVPVPGGAAARIGGAF